MGEVIKLSERRAARRAREARSREPSRAELFFDLACPFTYLAVERVERAYDDVIWTPAYARTPRAGDPALDQPAVVALRGAAEERAVGARLPLVWPERFPAAVPAAMRVAAHASESGRGAAFVLAATRLAFCGGFDLDDPEILAEAAAAAGILVDDCMRVAGDGGRDGAIEAAGRRLLAVGADRMPALRVGRALCWGEPRVTDVAAAARMGRAVGL